MKGKLKNPMLTAAAIAVACMFLDDLPGPGYNTFHDPGASAMLSVIFANAITVILWRGRWILAILAFLPALFLKGFVQPFFWVQNADVWDVLALGAANALLGFAVLHKASLNTRFTCACIACCAIGAGLLTVAMIFGGVQMICWRNPMPGWIVNYIVLGTSRVIIPTFFWFGVVLVEKHPTPPSAPREELSSCEML